MNERKPRWVHFYHTQPDHSRFVYQVTRCGRIITDKIETTDRIENVTCPRCKEAT